MSQDTTFDFSDLTEEVPTPLPITQYQSPIDPNSSEDDFHDLWAMDQSFQLKTQAFVAKLESERPPIKTVRMTTSDDALTYLFFEQYEEYQAALASGDEDIISKFE